MIYVISLISGIVNGIFASGAGQILVLYLVFVKKIDSHIGRATSLICTTTATIIAIIRYNIFLNIEYNKLIVVIICGLLFGYIGTKFMNKIESNKLNLISGTIITLFALYSLFVGG